MTTATHDTDFYSWTQQQAGLLRQGRLTELDIANLIEEIEDMGRSERRELESRLAVLLMHLLKWRYQPKQRGNSWRFTIKTQRKLAKKVLLENPGFKSTVDNVLADAYDSAQINAVKETRLTPDTFPTECPWTLEQVFDDEFWPDN